MENMLGALKTLLELPHSALIQKDVTAGVKRDAKTGEWFATNGHLLLVAPPTDGLVVDGTPDQLNRIRAVIPDPEKNQGIFRLITLDPKYLGQIASFFAGSVKVEIYIEDREKALLFTDGQKKAILMPMRY